MSPILDVKYYFFFVNKKVESVLGFSGALEGKKFSNCISILLDD